MNCLKTREEIKWLLGGSWDLPKGKWIHSYYSYNKETINIPVIMNTNIYDLQFIPNVKPFKIVDFTVYS